MTEDELSNSTAQVALLTAAPADDPAPDCAPCPERQAQLPLRYDREDLDEGLEEKNTSNPPRAPPSISHNHPPPDDVLLTADQACKLLGLTRAGFYLQVSSGRLPRPVYPAPRAPRWWRSRLIEAVNKTEASPSDARAERRRAKLARIAAASA